MDLLRFTDWAGAKNVYSLQFKPIKHMQETLYIRRNNYTASLKNSNCWQQERERRTATGETIVY